MSGLTLSPRRLSRALLARQLLLERSPMPIEAAMEQVGGLQTQYAPSGYVGLWTRLAVLVHARRTGILLEEHRRRVFPSTNPFLVGTILVDGRVVAAWRLREGRIEIEEYEPISARDRDAIEDERAALEAFHA